MGKGGVGKTTLAAALALGLARRGHPVLAQRCAAEAEFIRRVSEVTGRRSVLVPWVMEPPVDVEGLGRLLE
ncbi:hypothetical protein Atep_17380 [Allochromatium tepidum]|uniref:CobQ/CobB/MinD/ParA nucleotide binding domain-containing protein n=2 Tax=Allochromatium tepidum TaxID=553982 RepID=A0ABM7QME8_9GAMM|nr:hypothetical protein Atep_17380 [Allochromatium tepidum]